MNNELVCVSRTVIHADGTSITDYASARLPDDLVLDDYAEVLRRSALVEALFLSLPTVSTAATQINHIPPCPPPPLNSLN